MHKELKPVVRALEAQGFEVVRTKKGHFRVLKNGRTVTMLPGTPSDRRSLRNSIAPARRYGFVWPPKR